MDTLGAFFRGQAARLAGAPHKVFDWNKAARLIREHKPQHASAGLSQDWEYTGGTIWEDGKPVLDESTYLSSNWATPELDMDGEIVDCFVMESDAGDWDAKTKWPQSALDILESKA